MPRCGIAKISSFSKVTQFSGAGVIYTAIGFVDLLGLFSQLGATHQPGNRHDSNENGNKNLGVVSGTASLVDTDFVVPADAGLVANIPNFIVSAEMLQLQRSISPHGKAFIAGTDFHIGQWRGIVEDADNQVLEAKLFYHAVPRGHEEGVHATRQSEASVIACADQGVARGTHLGRCNSK